MYLYTPIDGRSLVIERITISGTGTEFKELMSCLDLEVGKLLNRENLETLRVLTLELDAPKVEITPMPQTEETT